MLLHYMMRLVVTHDDGEDQDISDEDATMSEASSLSSDSRSSIESSLSSISRSSFTTVYANMIDVVENIARIIFVPIVDADINFSAPKKLIQDFNHSQCQLEFRFRKLDLQMTANLLRPRLVPF